MKRVFATFLLILTLIMTCSCERNGEKEVVCALVFADDAKERDRLIAYVTELLDGADSRAECEKRLISAGYEPTKEFFERRFYAGRFFGSGYYAAFRIGEGARGWQYVAYPFYVDRSLEEYNDAGYGSFFYEIIKKMEARDQNEKD